MLTAEHLAQIVTGHVLLAFFNCIQPGVFALSAWDMLGIANLNKQQVSKWTDVDGDWRWLNRGAFDLLDNCPTTLMTPLGIPRGHSLYGSLRQQLVDDASFLSQVRKLIAFRDKCGIATGELVETALLANGVVSCSLFSSQLSRCRFRVPLQAIVRPDTCHFPEFLSFSRSV